jgi:surface-anchored protein
MIKSTTFQTIALVFLGMTVGWLKAEWHVYSVGHLDLRFLYDETPGSGLQIRFVDFSTDEIVDPALVTMRVPGAAIETRPEGAVWDATGVEESTRFWVLPQSQKAGILWLGTRSLIDTNAFRPLPPAPVFGSGQLSLRLLAAEGSGVEAGGEFSLFSTDAFGFPTFAWATADEIDEGDLIAPINVDSHTHYNWAFTEPGDYVLTIEVTGYTREEGTELKAQETIHFQVIPQTTVSPEGLSLSADGVLDWDDPSVDAPVVLWRSADLERWWIEAVISPPIETHEVEFTSSGPPAFWRTSDPVNAQ